MSTWPCRLKLRIQIFLFAGALPFFFFSVASAAGKECHITFLPRRLEVFERFSERTPQEVIIGLDTTTIESTATKAPVHLPIFRHPDFPEFVTIEPLDVDTLIPHEILAARKYGRFMQRRGLQFVFIANFMNRPVPDFDGLVVHPQTGRVLTNVSLKSTRRATRTPTLETLISDLQHRIDNIHNAVPHFLNLNSWFDTINGGPSHFRNSEVDLARALAITNLFGLFNEKSSLFGRPFQTVVDMQESGFSYEFVRNRKTTAALRHLIQKNGIPIGFTLIWNENQIVEISAPTTN